MYTFDTPLDHVLGFGQKITAALAKKSILTVGDLLLVLPIRYEDRRLMLTVAELKANPVLTPGQLPTILAKVESVTTFRRGSKSVERAVVSDQTGKLNLSWFNSPFVLLTLKKGENYYFSGSYNPQYRSLTQPSIEKPKATAGLHTGRLVPVYSSTLGVKPGLLRRGLKNILDHLQPIQETTEPIKQEFNQVFQKLHFPEEIGDVELARRRLALEELLLLIQQATHLKTLHRRRRASICLSTNSIDLTDQIKRLPFTLTQAQHKALQEVLLDLSQTYPANRMLQGDVGSGKTIVAGLASQAVVRAGSNVFLIAPTRVLAEQHLATLNSLLPDLPTQLLLGGSKSKKTTTTIKPQPSRLFIGTQALLNQVESLNPGFIIYDEQHRFGVRQRTQTEPHVLTMTATPIPRSLMLSVFSYLDLSIIDQLPEGRVPVKTWVIPKTKKTKAMSWIKQEVQQNQGLALVVCPFIDPSASWALENIKAATDTYAELKPIFEPEVKTALIHGKLKKPEQSAVISQAETGQIQVLVSTAIIEVGVDLPAASIMVIEAADRFGLASLHQLRGRVGRRNQQAYCLVFTDSNEPKVIERLTKFTQITNGQTLAELDLKNRGAGELFGLAQHGFGSLKYASWADVSLIKQAQAIAQYLPKTWHSSIFTHLHQSSDLAVN